MVPKLNQIDPKPKRALSGYQNLKIFLRKINASDILEKTFSLALRPWIRTFSVPFPDSPLKIFKILK